MTTTRETLKATAFRVAEIRREARAWSTDGLLQDAMPRGWFVVLDPCLPPLDSAHCGVGLKSKLHRSGETALIAEHQMGRQEEDGRLCLFFSEDTFGEMLVGDRIDLVEA